MKVYIAASLEDGEIARYYASTLEETLSAEITFKWWECEPHPDSLEEKMQQICAEEMGIINCDVFIFYNGEKKTSGKYVEYGMAEILWKPIIIIGEEPSMLFKHRAKTFIGKYEKNLIEQIIHAVSELSGMVIKARNLNRLFEQ